MSEGSGPGARVLVVDDEQGIAELVAMALRYEGFDVAVAGTGAAALASAGQRQPDLVLLDVMLPDLDGFEVARKLHAMSPRLPIVFLTARDTTEDKVRGLTLGGDDYVTKPFSLEELVARAHAVLRRVAGAGHEGAERLEVADLVMDLDSREVWRAGELVTLTDTEFRLLRYLMANKRRVLTRAQILDHVWDYDFGGDAGVLETYVSYLRKKVDAVEPRLIHTVRGVGYVIRPPAPARSTG